MQAYGKVAYKVMVIDTLEVEHIIAKQHQVTSFVLEQVIKQNVRIMKQNICIE